MHIPSYSKVFAIGHKQILDLFDGSVLVEEKIDGSQFSMCRKDGELFCRSKGKDLVIDAPEKMFERAVETAKSLDLHDGWIYRCEYLQKPHHNTLTYDRIPDKHLILFDIDVGLEDYMSSGIKRDEANRIGLEVSPFLYIGNVCNLELLLDFLNCESVLGGTKIEGVVVKNYSKFTPDGKAMMGKYVSEKFKEKHQTQWKKTSPQQNDILQSIIESFTTEARWEKAIQHLAEQGKLEGSPRDIGPLIKEIPEDIRAECEDEIKDVLFKWAWGHIRRGVTKGAAEWYKERLAKAAFDERKNNAD